MNADQWLDLIIEYACIGRALMENGVKEWIFFEDSLDKFAEKVLGDSAGYLDWPRVVNRISEQITERI